MTIAKSLDHLNIETLDGVFVQGASGFESWFPSPVSGSDGPTPFAIDASLKLYAVAAGIPASKLAMTMALAAVCYSGGITAPRQPSTAEVEVVGGEGNYPLSAFFAGTSTFSSAPASSQLRDGMAQVPYLSLKAPVADKVCGLSTQYVTYEDETSIIAKGTFSKQWGYGGVVIVDIQDGWLPAGAAGGRAPNALMQAFKTGFLTP